MKKTSVQDGFLDKKDLKKQLVCIELSPEVLLCFQFFARSFKSWELLLTFHRWHRAFLTSWVVLVFCEVCSEWAQVHSARSCCSGLVISPLDGVQMFHWSQLLNPSGGEDYQVSAQVNPVLDSFEASSSRQTKPPPALMVVEDRLMVDHGAFKVREWRLQHFGFHLCIFEKLDAHRNPVLAPPRHLSAPAAKGIAKSEFQRMKAVSAMQKAMPKSTRERSHLLSSFIIVYVQWDCTRMLLCFRTRQNMWCILSYKQPFNRHEFKPYGSASEEFQPPWSWIGHRFRLVLPGTIRSTLNERSAWLHFRCQKMSRLYTAAAVVIPCAFLWRDFLKLRIVTTSLQQIGGEDQIFNNTFLGVPASFSPRRSLEIEFNRK